MIITRKRPTSANPKLRASALATIVLLMFAGPTAVAGAETPGETATPPDPSPATSSMSSPRLRGAAPDPLFARQEVLDFRLAGPLRAVAADSAAEPEEHPALMSWTDADGNLQSLEIEIRARGKSRRNRGQCGFPPIRLDIPRSQADDTLFEAQDKLKLVTQCRTLGSRAGGIRDWVNLEYFTYRILNHITDYSFRVRPVTATYVTEDGESFRHPGFIIEHKDRMAARLGLELIEVERIASSQLAMGIAQVMDLFQYMVGNTDYSFLAGPEGDDCCHNAVLLSDASGTPLVPVPYDFDRTGVVNKPGALPAEGMRIRRVTQRQYRGYCRDEAHLRAAVELFVEARGAIEQELDETLDVSDRGRNATVAFLGQFYDTITSEEQLQRHIAGRCRG